MRDKKVRPQGLYFAFFFFASARRLVFFRRFARFLALSLPLLCPISFNTPCRASLGLDAHDDQNTVLAWSPRNRSSAALSLSPLNKSAISFFVRLRAS